MVQIFLTEKFTVIYARKSQDITGRGRPDFELRS